MEQTETSEPPKKKKKVKLWLKITKTFPLDVEISDTIGSIKDQIRSIEGTSLEHQQLFFGGNLLKDAKTLADYNFPTDSNIDVHVEGIMQIFLKLPSMDKTLKFSVKYMDTAQNVKVMIQKEVGLSLNQQLLVFSGKALDDNQVLIACGVRKDSTLYVIQNPLAELLLYVQMSSGDSFEVEVMAGCTIRDMKVMIESLKGVPPSRQKLLHNKLELSNSFSLSYILHKSIIQLQVGMHIFVKIKSGRTVTIEVQDSDTVAVTITKIESKAGLKGRNFKLSYAGKVLQDQKMLADYGIQRDSEIKVIICPATTDSKTW